MTKFRKKIALVFVGDLSPPKSYKLSDQKKVKLVHTQQCVLAL